MYCLQEIYKLYEVLLINYEIYLEVILKFSHFLYSVEDLLTKNNCRDVEGMHPSKKFQSFLYFLQYKKTPVAFGMM